MKTFEEVVEIAEKAKYGPIDPGVYALCLLKELAESLHRLEYNTAYQLALLGMGDFPAPKMSDGPDPMGEWEGLLHWKTQAALLALRSEPLV